MDEMNQNTTASQKMILEIASSPNLSEKENDDISSLRSSLPPISSSSTRKSHVSSLPFKPIDVVTVTTTTGCISNQCRVSRNKGVTPTSVSFERNTTPMSTSSSIIVATNDDDIPSYTNTAATNTNKSYCSMKSVGGASLRSSSPVSSTTFPTNINATSLMSLCGKVDTSSSLSLDVTSMSDLHHPIELFLQQYPTELLSRDSSKITKLQQLAMSLTTATDDTEGERGTTETCIASNATELVNTIMTDMLQLHQMLMRAENRISELQCTPEKLSSHEDDRPIEGRDANATTSNHIIESQNGKHDVKKNSFHNDIDDDVGRATRVSTNNPDDIANQNCSSNTVTVLQARIANLEQELQTSQTTITQLKAQKQHVIANTKKKKLLLDDMQHQLFNTEKELQSVLSERNQLRVSLQEMTDIRDSYKQKLRNQQEIVKDSKQSMMEYKNKLQKTQHMRSLENELLDNFRKLAIHTGL